MKIMKILELHLRNTKILKTFEFQFVILKNYKNHIIPNENHETNENPRIPHGNQSNHENHFISLENN